MDARILAIFGPTGVGKTAVAIAVADRLRARGERPVAVSADAMQVYAGLGVLSGAATAAEQGRLEHRLVGHVPVTQTYSAGAFAADAHAQIDGLLAEGSFVIVVGGTGLYLRAALAALELRPPVEPAIRARWHALLGAQGPEALHDALQARDPDVAARIAATDGRRLVRTLELLDAGLAPPTADDGQLWTRDTRHPTRLVGLTMDRDALYAAIDARVDKMVASGAEAEVRAALTTGASDTARMALGFTALQEGDVDAMKASTRRYSKRQLTWMRKLPGAQVLDITGRSAEDVALELVP